MQPPNDIDSYIHRSGRTARAGKTGTCITLVSGYENRMLKDIERAAGIKFKQEGLPDPNQLVTKQIDNLEHVLTPVEPKIWKMFEKIATKLILEKGALNAVSLVLAHMTGADDIMQEKSLINGKRDYTTMTLKTNSRVENFHYVNNILKRVIPFEAKIRFESVEIGRNRKVAYFDIPKDKVDLFFDLVAADQENEYHRYYQIEKTKSLDKNTLLTPYARQRGQNRGFRGRSNNRGGNRRSNNNYNNRGGSYNRGGYNNNRGGYNDDRRGNNNNRGGYNNRNRNDSDDYFSDK